ncbi:YdcF family protein [Staphylococcus hominis]|nr:YdcF family protein [Staphylococcus hominis]MCI2838287.1 YdcF family protein [Staphylococcus hominis]MCI2847492.1 YdcF family protein [Staphylococcus hominis]MCI2849585.1 YdcF family protein [Staphylococcus hominis]MCI2854488.1 YdcF family protein [Staphylococcus hominis]MCI2886639.1 YdcF family protein [Staphylococcus hominis]
MTMTLPTGLFILIIISTIGLLVKHSHLFKIKKGTRFLNKMFRRLINGVLFIGIFIYLSTIPLPILNGMFLWIALILFSACYAFIIYLIFSSAFERAKTHKQYDMILILGAGIFNETVTPMLASRLDRALEIYKVQSHNCNILVSGGQGPDEPISEALAMKNYLIKCGVSSSSILMESQSSSTYENFLYSKSFINTSFENVPSILCVTSQFHILRALRFAQKLNIKIIGLGSSTPYHFLDKALLRDFLALIYQYKLLLTLYLVGVFIASIWILL